MKKILNLPLSIEDISTLQAGDEVLLNGIMYTARDAAHKRLNELIATNQPLPITLDNQTLYYVGPTPPRPNQVVGSAGPTSSYRMDKYTLPLIKRGLRVMIGKGKRNAEIKQALKDYQVVYLGVIGGAAALISECIVKSTVVAFDDLGTEAIHEYHVKDFPAFVLMDIYGNDMYESEPLKYQQHQNI